MTLVFRHLLLAAAVSLCAAQAEQGKDGFLPLADGLVPLDSDAGRHLMTDSASAPFWRLIQFYGIQPNLATCGVASCTMVLNALPIERPVSASHGEFRLFTPENFFTPAVSAIVTREKVSQSGMSLGELAKVLATWPVEVTPVLANRVRVEDFRAEVKRCTAGPDRLLLANYLRKALGQESGGHISPIGAYSAERDMILILDVSTYKYPWVWVETSRLFEAMGGNDDGPLSRGFVTVAGKTANSR